MNIKLFIFGLFSLLVLGLIIFLIIKRKKTKETFDMNRNGLITEGQDCSSTPVPYKMLPPPPGSAPYIIDTRSSWQYFLQVWLPVIEQCVKIAIQIGQAIASEGSSITGAFKTIKSGLSSVLSAISSSSSFDLVEGIANLGKYITLGLQYIGKAFMSAYKYLKSGNVVGDLWNDITKVFGFLKNINKETVKYLFDHVKNIVTSGISYGKDVQKFYNDNYNKVVKPGISIGVLLKNTLKKQAWMQGSMNTGEFVSGYDNYLTLVQQAMQSNGGCSTDLNTLWNAYNPSAKFLSAMGNCGGSDSTQCQPTYTSSSTTKFDTNSLSDMWGIQSTFENTNALSIGSFYNTLLSKEGRTNLTQGTGIGTTNVGLANLPIISTQNVIDSLFALLTVNSGVPFNFLSDCIQMIISIYESLCIYNTNSTSQYSDEFMLANEYLSADGNINSDITNLKSFYSQIKNALTQGQTSYINSLQSWFWPTDQTMSISISNGIRVLQIPVSSTIDSSGVGCCNDANNACSQIGQNGLGFQITTNSMATYCGARVSNASQASVVGCNLYFYYCDYDTTPGCTLGDPTSSKICSIIPMSSVQTFFLNSNQPSADGNPTFALLDANYCPQRLYLSTINLGNGVVGAVGYSQSNVQNGNLAKDYINSIFYLVRCKDVLSSLGDPFQFYMSTNQLSSTFFPLFDTVFESSVASSYYDLVQAQVLRYHPVDVANEGVTPFKVIFDNVIGTTSFLGGLIPAKYGNYNVAFDSKTDIHKKGICRSPFVRYRRKLKDGEELSYSPSVTCTLIKTYSNCPKLAFSVGEFNPYLDVNTDYNIDLSLQPIMTIPSRMSFMTGTPVELPLFNDIDNFYQYVDDSVIYANFHFSSSGLPTTQHLLYLDFSDTSYNLLDLSVSTKMLVPSVMFYTRQLNTSNPYANMNINCSEDPNGSYSSTYLTDYPGYVFSCRDAYLYISQGTDPSSTVCNTVDLASIQAPVSWMEDQSPTGDVLDNFIVCGNMLRINTPDPSYTFGWDLSGGTCTSPSTTINVSIYENQYMYQLDFFGDQIYLQTGTTYTLLLNDYISYIDPYNAGSTAPQINIPINDIVTDYLNSGTVTLSPQGIVMNYNVNNYELSMTTYDSVSGGGCMEYTLLASFIIPKYIFYPYPTPAIGSNSFYSVGPNTTEQLNIINQSGCFCWQISPKAVNVVISLDQITNLGHTTPNNLQDIETYGDVIGYLPAGFPLPVKSVIVPTSYKGVSYSGNSNPDLPIFAMIDTNGYIYLYRGIYCFNGAQNEIYSNITINFSYITTSTNEFVIYSPYNVGTTGLSSIYMFNSVENSIPHTTKNLPTIYTVNSTKIFANISCVGMKDPSTNLMKLIPLTDLTSLPNIDYGKCLFFDSWVTTQTATLLQSCCLTTDQYGNYSIDMPSSCQDNIQIQGRITYTNNPDNRIPINFHQDPSAASIPTIIDNSTYLVLGNFVAVSIDISMNTSDIENLFPNNNWGLTNTFFLDYIDSSECTFNRTNNNKISVPIVLTSTDPSNPNSSYQGSIVISTDTNIDNINITHFSLSVNLSDIISDFSSFHITSFFVYSPFLGCTVFRNTYDMIPS